MNNDLSYGADATESPNWPGGARAEGARDDAATRGGDAGRGGNGADEAGAEPRPADGDAYTIDDFLRPLGLDYSGDNAGRPATMVISRDGEPVTEVSAPIDRRALVLGVRVKWGDDAGKVGLGPGCYSFRVKGVGRDGKSGKLASREQVTITEQEARALGWTPPPPPEVSRQDAKTPSGPEDEIAGASVVDKMILATLANLAETQKQIAAALAANSGRSLLETQAMEAVVSQMRRAANPPTLLERGAQALQVLSLLDKAPDSKTLGAAGRLVGEFLAARGKSEDRMLGALDRFLEGASKGIEAWERRSERRDALAGGVGGQGGLKLLVPGDFGATHAG
ncbi:MAG: hypothetical protein HY719_13765 [Planctomycetes bacterium]|nr:hypothetical protein [Planctomycetota bacterium]